MSAEIICVGTEILLGDITNTNAQYLARELADLGIPHYYQTTVGDNCDRIHQAIQVACNRSTILIFTGGLGPTPDDLTHDAIASFFETPLTERPEIVRDISEKFAQRGRTMTPNNLKQAQLPAGADILPNPRGTAPGIVWQPRENLLILTFPGVPSEMKPMWKETAVPALKQQGWGKHIIYSRTLKFWGIGESALAAKVAPFFDLTNPTVAPYASYGLVKLRVSAKAESEATAIALIEPIARQLQEIAGEDYFGCDEETLASIVGTLLRESGETLSVAESCTGGALGAMLTDIPGSSDYFLGGIISYSNDVKISALGVRPESLQQYGAVSETVAREMALGVKACLNSDWGLSITGVAGPGGGSDEKPVGLVYIALAAPDKTVEVFEFRFGTEKERAAIRSLSTGHALDRLRRRLLA
ncbi:competence/damage-inducible protein A [Oscillatoria sp. FACHB-1406]|uniref:competence/damage-inducible protein A n=1 Tax=Oscillatoria sp. FACHB-1406 TaxID=2692846 RepID=UPI0016827F39|nr:competence/damage-inducible protein A [Oscillatoria sp. FACHB-1406]MBD2576958.1 competence/damage-inducible protein A [Oscillatoria sp. FACHB-1406]